MATVLPLTFSRRTWNETYTGIDGSKTGIVRNALHIKFDEQAAGFRAYGWSFILDAREIFAANGMKNGSLTLQMFPRFAGEVAGANVFTETHLDQNNAAAYTVTRVRPPSLHVKSRGGTALFIDRVEAVRELSSDGLFEITIDIDSYSGNVPTVDPFTGAPNSSFFPFNRLELIVTDYAKAPYSTNLLFS